jgi:hypothetical protein
MRRVPLGARATRWEVARGPEATLTPKPIWSSVFPSLIRPDGKAFRSVARLTMQRLVSGRITQCLASTARPADPVLASRSSSAEAFCRSRGRRWRYPEAIGCRYQGAWLTRMSVQIQVQPKSAARPGPKLSTSFDVFGRTIFRPVREQPMVDGGPGHGTW